jgi:p21-activated kinase 1
VLDDAQFYADPSESLPSAPSTEYVNSTPGSTIGIRSRSGTTSKTKKGVLSLMSEMFNPTKRPEISTPYDPVHLTHVGFNSSTGEFTGLPKEWQQLLQESGISRSDQEKHPQAVMEIVKFYQEGHGDVWDKLGNVGGAQDTPLQSRIEESFQNPRSPPPPPKKQGSQASTLTTPVAPTAYRPAPTPPSAATPALDRSTSHRITTKVSKSADLGRSNTTRDRPAQGGQSSAAQQEKQSTGSSSSDLPLKPSQPGASSATVTKERSDPRVQNQAPGPAASSLAKVSGVATPRRREKKSRQK